MPPGTPPAARPFEPGVDTPWAEDLLARELAGRMQARRGELMDPLAGDVLGGVLAGRPVGLIGWVVGGAFSKVDEAEVRVLVVEPDARRKRVGTVLLAEAERRMSVSGVRAAWLVTTNDNVDAIAFYARAGWFVAAIIAGAVDEARRTIKPSIAEVAENGIPIRDELILSKVLRPIAGT
jgi:ribosomal protein S18 acetylase RimI-like enzyme